VGMRKLRAGTCGRGLSNPSYTANITEYSRLYYRLLQIFNMICTIINILIIVKEYENDLRVFGAS
jgi:hypothetical protein